MQCVPSLEVMPVLTLKEQLEAGGGQGRMTAQEMVPTEEEEYSIECLSNKSYW